MKTLLAFGVAALAALSLSAAGFEAGKGVANDHATGVHSRDVTFVQRGGGNGYGYRQYALPVGLTLLSWAPPNFESSVYGVRLNFGWGRYEQTWGLDAGAFSRSARFGGIAANLFGNWATADQSGLVAGLVNAGEEVNGLQVGAVNMAGRLRGVQIGFLNFNRAGIVFPVINIGW